METSLFFTTWPWMGLGGAMVLIVLAFFTDALRADTSRPRWRDPTWVAWIAAVAYMLHNFEEYGMDLTGQQLGFWLLMNPFGPAVTEAAYLGCNLPFVWVVGPTLAALSRKRPALAGAMPSIELVNGMSHIGMAARVGYNAGLATSVVLFLPIALWSFALFFAGRGGFGKATYLKMLGVSALYMAFVVSMALLTNAGMLLAWPAQLAYIVAATALVGWLWWKAARVKDVEPER